MLSTFLIVYFSIAAFFAFCVTVSLDDNDNPSVIASVLSFLLWPLTLLLIWWLSRYYDTDE